ncbi:MAG: MbcA/ParS/Xre antitoxin family protein [Marinobacter sp.]|uniref:MbcA/ParS/Xre antitoxin family protein n=1 Tax=Marinobacter sp. TaxID=50741 RepID=UPI0034A0311A
MQLGLSLEDWKAIVCRERTDSPECDSSLPWFSKDRALHLIRIYTALHRLMGGDDHAMKHWIKASNHALSAPPGTVIRTLAGMEEVVQYLEAC